MSFDLDKALEHRVILLSGDEESLRRRALGELLASDAVDEFDLEVFQCGDSSPGQWFGSASTAPFLGARRVVVVRNLLRLDDPADALKRESCNLASLPDTALLILVAEEEMGDENRQKKFGTTRSAWEKLVTAAKGKVVSFKTDPKGVLSLARQEVQKHGKSISHPAAALLVEMTGGSLSRVIEETEKLVLYVGDGKEIREADVKAVVVPSLEWNVFTLVDAVVAGNAAQALRQLRIVLGGGKKPEETAFRSILPQLSRQFRLIWQARVCLEAKVDAANPPPEILALFPEKNRISAGGDFVRNKAVRAARMSEFRQLGACLSEISDCDAALKGMLPSAGGSEALELMVLRMVQAMGRSR